MVQTGISDVSAEIIEWVHDQPYWVQLAVTKICANQEITDNLIDELLSALKTEDGQSNDNKIDLSTVLKAPSAAVGDVRLLSIGDIEGIDALAPRSPLPFDQKLSVIYGNNGSGKSGYARILKKLCGKPNALELQPNVFKILPQKRQCTVVASIDGSEKSFVWAANSNPIKELSTIDVFDSQTGLFYIDKEQEISYVPYEVALFERLVLVFQKLQQKLKAEQDAIKTILPSRPTEFGNSKYISAMFDRLKHDTDIATVEDFFEFTQDDAGELTRLEERLSASPVDLANKKQKRINQLELLIGQVKTASLAVAKEKILELEEFEIAATQKRKIAMQAAEAIVDETSFDGFGNETWKAMWQAAREYSEQYAYTGNKYPVVAEAAKCVLCEQDLSDAAKHRLVKFESYVSGQLESSATAAEKHYQDTLGKLPVKPNKTELVTAIQAAQLDEDRWLPIFTEIWDEIEKVVTNEKNKDRDSRIHFALGEEALKEIEVLIEGLKLEAQQHNKDAESFDKGELARQISDLKAKKWASGYIQSIKDEISQLKSKNEIEEWQKTVNPRAVSIKAGRVSELVVTDAFVSRFKSELKLLGASKVNIELVKARTEHGRVKHKIQLSGLDTQNNRSKAMNVLSEGEQRIVSLAAFLADVTSKPNSAPFIFDDPISSLDQIYEEHTAKRLVDLCEERQVIVFTHRLSLLGQLIDKGNAEYRHIRREHWGAGEHGDIPLFAKKPINAVKDLKNTRLSAARKIYEEHGSESYYPLGKSICSDFRILLERIVEFELLADVVTRHRRELHTKGKIHKLAKIIPEDCELIEKLMSDFSCFEHSQSNDLPVEIPEPEALEAALTKVIDWHDEFNKRSHEPL